MYVLYAEIDKFNPLNYKDFKSNNIMDKWIISELNTLVKEVDEKLEKYDITSSANQIEAFTDRLSNWYVRRNRERFWGTELTDDKIGAYVTLYRVLVFSLYLQNSQCNSSIKLFYLIMSLSLSLLL